MKKTIITMLLALSPMLSVQCISEGMIISAMESGGIPGYILIHKNPSVGDYAVYATGATESRIQVERTLQPDGYEVSQNIGDMPYSLRLHVKGSGEVIKAELLNLKTGERKPVRMQNNGPNSVEKVRTIPLDKPTDVATPAGTFKITQSRQIQFRPTGNYKGRSTSLINDDVPFLAVKTVVVSEELSREEMSRIDPSHGLFTGVGNFQQKFELKEFKKN